MTSVCALILTYNRKALLEQCLHAVAAQTRPCDRIIVIDNASTDGTREWLMEKWGRRIELYVLPTNVGPSGGFNMGLKIAYERGDDCLWLLDDDVIPAPDALNRLFEASALLESRGVSAPFVISTARAPDGTPTNVPQIYTGAGPSGYAEWPNLLEFGLLPVKRATFVSILFKRDILRQHGFPIADFFIWGEDTEYTKRITRKSPGFTVGDSSVLHVRAIPGPPDINTERDPVRVGYHYFSHRNAFYDARKDGLEAIYYQIKGRLGLIKSLAFRREFLKLRVVLKGCWDGFFFNPKIEHVETAQSGADLRVTPRLEPAPFEFAQTAR